MSADRKAYAAEFVGTFALIFVGAGSVCMESATAGALSAGKLGVTGIAFAHGLTIMAMAAALGHVSGGHFNPAVTLAMAATRRIGAGKALGYVAAQLAGAAAGAYLLKCVAAGTGPASLGVCALDRVGFGAGVAIEAAITFLLVTVIFGTAVDPAGRTPIAPLAIGLTITADILAAGPLTGAAINPARAFGPALAAGQWADHAVWWIGPVAGAVAAALAYDRLLHSKERA